jgi:lipopolysaccharide transport system ATP-binding protein
MPVIKAENLSKQYRIGTVRGRYKTFRESVTETLLAPFQKLSPKNSKSEYFWALKDVSFEIEQGEVVGIIGANGAGKSTLLKILSRITKPTQGEVMVRGRLGALLEVGTGFHPELTGRENVYLNGAILGMNRQEMARKFDEIVDFAGVEKFIDTPVKHYSSGMELRLGFAVAAHLEPDILIVDEVLAVGDASFQQKSLGKMNQVASEGRTVLFVSHNMSAVSSLCTKAYWLNHGTIEKVGNAAEVVRNYLSSDTAISSSRNLRDNALHQGSHHIIQSVQLLHCDELDPVFKTYSTFSFEVECKVDIQQVRHGSVGYNIKNDQGHVICAGHLDQYQRFTIETEIFHVNAEVVQLPFVPGTYFLSLFFVSSSNNLDIIENAISFKVVWNEDIPLEYPPRPNWGDIYLPMKWNIVSDEVEKA